MELSTRLKAIAKLIENCNTVADIGSDHGYIPIYVIEEKIAKRAIASDINIGPVKRAQTNIISRGLEDRISCRRGAGLATLGFKEAEAVIIAGMGGNLIRDIILEDMEKVVPLQYMILQPAQNPEVLREFLYKNDFEVLKEELTFDEGKYYEIFKVRYSKRTSKEKDNEFSYELSSKLLHSGNPLINEYIKFKLSSYEKILKYIKEDSEAAIRRKHEVEMKIEKLKEVIKCL